MKVGIGLAVVVLSGSLMLNVFAQTGGATKQQKSPVVSQHAKETWVCPMHADVSSDKAGTCTKCGMALEKRVAANGAKHAKRDAEGKTCQGKTKEECKKNCEGMSKEECKKNCEGMSREECKKNCEGMSKEECKKNCEGMSREECKKNCEGMSKEGCKGECFKAGEAGCAAKH